MNDNFETNEEKGFEYIPSFGGENIPEDDVKVYNTGTYEQPQTNCTYENIEQPEEENMYEQPIYTETVEKEKKKMKKTTKLALLSLGSGICGAVLTVVIALSLLTSGILKVSVPSHSNIVPSKIYTSVGSDEESETAGSYADMIDSVGPAVVGINCEAQYEDWFWGTSTQKGTGSGVIINEDGFIVTNSHVVEGAEKIQVTLIDGTVYDAKPIGTDSRTDLAVIKIEPEADKKLTFAAFGDSSQMRVGDSVIAIGNPLGEEFAGSATKGIISATNRTVNISNKTLTVLQTDAAINPGNSGGALVNAKGEVIGINTAKIADSTVEGLGFAIPSNELLPVIDELMTSGRVSGRPLIGITGRPITEQLSKQYGYPIGVYVVEVVEFSAAEDAGIRNKDVILEVNGETVKTVEDINNIRDKFKAGDKLDIKLYRKSADKNLNVELILGEDTTGSVQ